MNASILPIVALSSSLYLLAAAAGLYHLGPIWDEIATRRTGAQFDRALQLGFPKTVLLLLLKLWGLGLLLVILLSVYVLASYPAAVIFGWLTFQSPSLFLRYWIRKRERTLRDQLVGASVGLANSARAGLSLNESIVAVIPDTPAPLRTELESISHRYSCGIDLGEAIQQSADQLQLEPFTLLASALRTTIEGGGNLAEAMIRISKSLQDHQRLERKMDANTANARRSANIMTVFPIVFIGLMYKLAPESTNLLFTTLPGQIALAVVCVMVYSGKRWMDRLTTFQH